MAECAGQAPALPEGRIADGQRIELAGDAEAYHSITPDCCLIVKKVIKDRQSGSGSVLEGCFIVIRNLHNKQRLHGIVNNRRDNNKAIMQKVLKRADKESLKMQCKEATGRWRRETLDEAVSEHEDERS